MDINGLAVIFLNNLNGFGPKTIANLIKKVKNLELIWQLNDNQLKNLGLKTSKIKEFNKYKNKFKADKIAADLKKENIKYLTLYDQKYPQKLKEIYDPPPVIFYK